MTTGTRKPSDFCWMNMLTPKPADALAFYGNVLGWTFIEMPGMGHRVQVGGRDIGAIFDIAGPNTPPGTRPHIGVMIKVESADATCARVNVLGGKAMPPFNIMESGRMAVCYDPNGAEFDIWEPKKMTGTDVDNHLHGAPTWFETITTDVERGQAFYSALFGWTAAPMPMQGYTYTVFKLDGVPVSGMMAATPEMGAMRPHWGTYFCVKHADESARFAAELGATICVPLQDIPAVGRFCGIVSPQGVMFYVIAYRS